MIVALWPYIFFYEYNFDLNVICFKSNDYVC